MEAKEACLLDLTLNAMPSASKRGVRENKILMCLDVPLTYVVQVNQCHFGIEFEAIDDCSQGDPTSQDPGTKNTDRGEPGDSQQIFLCKRS